MMDMKRRLKLVEIALDYARDVLELPVVMVRRFMIPRDSDGFLQGGIVDGADLANDLLIIHINMHEEVWDLFLVESVIHECRHIWQHLNGGIVHDPDIKPYDQLYEVDARKWTEDHITWARLRILTILMKGGE